MRYISIDNLIASLSFTISGHIRGQEYGQKNLRTTPNSFLRTIFYCIRYWRMATMIKQQENIIHTIVIKYFKDNIEQKQVISNLQIEFRFVNIMTTLLSLLILQDNQVIKLRPITHRFICQQLYMQSCLIYGLWSLKLSKKAFRNRENCAQKKEDTFIHISSFDINLFTSTSKFRI